MLLLIAFILFLASDVVAQSDPTITSATDISFTTYTTTPLLPSDPDYVDEDLRWDTNGTLEKRTPPQGIYICSLSGWKGDCGWKRLEDNVCKDFPWDAAMSIGVSGSRASPSLSRSIWFMAMRLRSFGKE